MKNYNSSTIELARWAVIADSSLALQDIINNNFEAFFSLDEVKSEGLQDLLPVEIVWLKSKVKNKLKQLSSIYDTQKVIKLKKLIKYV